jgi:hypothetical protein
MQLRRQQRMHDKQPGPQEQGNLAAAVHRNPNMLGQKSCRCHGTADTLSRS